jgi:AbrB family looped-hinge helix DNA binding protein
VVLPKEVRKRLSLREGTKLKVGVEGRRIVISPRVEPEEFIREMEGFVREALRERPLEAKRIWESKTVDLP